LRFCAEAAKGLLVQARGVVIAQLAHVAGAQAPGLAGDNGGGDLTTGLN